MLEDPGAAGRDIAIFSGGAIFLGESLLYLKSGRAENVASPRLAAPGSPRMYASQNCSCNVCIDRHPCICYLALINRTGGLYGRILTEVVSQYIPKSVSHTTLSEILEIGLRFTDRALPVLLEILRFIWLVLSYIQHKYSRGTFVERPLNYRARNHLLKSKSQEK